MHLFSQEHLAASSGIVGASGPAAAGFALAAQHLRPGTLAVAFFGEGAANEGMLLEAMNLAVAWQLPVVFVCKDNRWSITTPSASVTGGELKERARAFGMPAAEVEAAEVLQDRGISTEVLDLRTVWPLDKQMVCEAANKTSHLLVVDEDYEALGLSGELAATLLEAGIQAKYARVCTQDTIPYSRQEEDRTLPNVDRIVDAALRLLG